MSVFFQFAVRTEMITSDEILVQEMPFEIEHT